MNVVIQFAGTGIGDSESENAGQNVNGKRGSVSEHHE
jgi:hypothetical protein